MTVILAEMEEAESTQKEESYVLLPVVKTHVHVSEGTY